MSLSHEVRKKWIELIDLGWFYLNGYSSEQIEAYRQQATGRFGFRSNRSIWIHGRTREGFIAAGGVIDSLRTIASESCFVLTSDDPVVESWLRKRFPDDRVFTYPLAEGDCAKRFMRNIAPKVILLLEESSGFNPKARAKAVKDQIPIILIDGKEESTVDGSLSHRCVREPSTAQKLCSEGKTPVTVTGSLLFESALMSAPVSSDGFCREAGVDRNTSFIFVDRPGVMEESHLLNALEQLQETHPEIIYLWIPPTVWHHRRMPDVFNRRGILFRRWGERSGGNPAVILLDPHLASSPFYSVCRAIIAGGSFFPLRLRDNPVEPVTRHAPVIFGRGLAKNATIARLWLERGAALQCSIENLVATLAPLIRENDQRDQVLARVMELLEPSRGAAQETIRVIAPFYPALPDEHPARAGWRKKKSREEREKLVNPAAHIEKIEVKDWEAFRRRLGNCRSILCLGNGPTSEDPQVIATPHDTLFRANWRWVDRGILTYPNAVFVGDPVTIGKMELPCTFVFPDSERAFNALRSTRIVTRKSPVEHFLLTQSSCEWLAELAKDTHARPTNGALMIATACALQPETLTIAGIDLFSHPDGRYPGELQAVNTYAGAHDPNYEILLIERALRQYRGKLVILSPILVEALKQRGFSV